MILEKKLGLAYECLSAIGNSLEVDSMMGEILDVFLRKTDASCAGFFAHRDDKKAWIKVGKGISFDFDRGDIESQTYILYHRKKAHLVIIPLDHGFLKFCYESDKDLKEIAEMLGDFQSKINLALSVCEDIGKIETIHVGFEVTKDEQNSKVNIFLQDKQSSKDLQEKIEIASKIKSDFIANINHEIRTPLNSILGFIELLRDEHIEGKPLEYVNIIENSSQNLLYIMEDILEFSQIENHKLNIDTRDFETQKEFQIITYLFKAKCSQKNISLALTLNDRLPAYIHSDPYRIKQILSNLISNAVKFTDRGKRIFVDIDYIDGELCISIRDEGEGMPQERIDAIFEEFAHEKYEDDGNHAGVKLGLAISYRLVNLLGGELKSKSEVGVGSEFYFHIPAAASKNINLKQCTLKDITFANKKILLVEDNKANQIFMRVVLGKLKVEFDIANDGLEAIEAFKKNKYDLILMDENMPNLNGIEAVKEILKIEKKMQLKHTIIIALTANAHHSDRKKFLDAGMDEYLTKPLDRIKFNKVLNGFFTEQKEDIV